MGKSKDTRRLQANQAQAVCNALRTSPRKLNLVAESIRGLDVQTALGIVTYNPRYASELIAKLLKSAIANAENNHQLNIDKLFVSEAYCGKGLVMKRMHARGRGRGARVLKPFSNITIVVTERQE